MANVKKVASLIAKKHEISKEIEDLQDDCRHFKKSVKSIPESLGSTSFIIRWICDDCEKVIGIPNDQELNKYLR